MKNQTLIFSAIMIVFTHSPAFAEYDVKWNTLNKKTFICGSTKADQAVFEAEIRYDLVTTASLPTVNKRKEIRLSVQEVTEKISEVDLWAAQILKVPVSEVMSGSESPYGRDKIETTLVIPFDKSANIMASVGVRYLFAQGYYTSPSVATYNLGKNQISRIFFYYGGQAEFELTAEHTGRLSLALKDLNAFVGTESTNTKKVRNIDMSKIKTQFTNMTCTEK